MRLWKEKVTHWVMIYWDTGQQELSFIVFLPANDELMNVNMVLKLRNE